mmetsp:Transcript_406/g.796  ORF Transcript_406/g.796 Transcript_406/m.796 type:complete len:255 (-) Transcript_406:836-1600(-)
MKSRGTIKLSIGRLHNAPPLFVSWKGPSELGNSVCDRIDLETVQGVARGRIELAIVTQLQCPPLVRVRPRVPRPMASIRTNAGTEIWADLLNGALCWIHHQNPVCVERGGIQLAIRSSLAVSILAWSSRKSRPKKFGLAFVRLQPATSGGKGWHRIHVSIKALHQMLVLGRPCSKLSPHLLDASTHWIIDQGPLRTKRGAIQHSVAVRCNAGILACFIANFPNLCNGSALTCRWIQHDKTASGERGTINLAVIS